MDEPEGLPETGRAIGVGRHKRKVPDTLRAIGKEPETGRALVLLRRVTKYRPLTWANGDN
jgi:hypothetical protein